MRTRARRVKPGRGPAHAQIARSLGEAIEAGRYRPGDRLPAERELAAQAGVSRMTLRHALSTLERRGLVQRRVGRDGGTFVAGPKLELAGLSALSDQLRALGFQAGAHVLEARERAARGDERQLGSRVYELVRVRLADEQPVALERTVLSARAYPDLLRHSLDGSLYDVIRAHYDDVPVRSVERLEPALASADDATALGIGAGAAVMHVARTAYDARGRAVEISRDVFRGDRTTVVWESEILPR